MGNDGRVVRARLRGGPSVAATSAKHGRTTTGVENTAQGSAGSGHGDAGSGQGGLIGEALAEEGRRWCDISPELWECERRSRWEGRGRRSI